MLALCACNERVSMYGDSEAKTSKAVLHEDLDPVISNIVYDRPGCGLLLNASAACVGGANWPALIASDLGDGKPKYVVVELGYNDAFYYAADYLRDNMPALIE